MRRIKCFCMMILTIALCGCGQQGAESAKDSGEAVADSVGQRNEGAEKEPEVTKRDIHEIWNNQTTESFFVKGYVTDFDEEENVFYLKTEEPLDKTNKMMLTKEADFLIYSDAALKVPIACSYQTFLKSWRENVLYEILVERYSEEDACWIVSRVLDMSEENNLEEKVEEGSLGHLYYHIQKTEESVLEITPVEPLYPFDEESKKRMLELYEEGRIDTPDPYGMNHYEGIYAVEYPEKKKTVSMTADTRYYKSDYNPYVYIYSCTEKEFFDKMSRDTIYRVIIEDGCVECIINIPNEY